ncbi:GAF and ANTAR domain-containing protein [Kineococcus sp. SYSU DK003]|uniref:GAF and ANTAR domain-containing protein n=1 Tax=Kineococcus sp. SYSU DK003 TaxID=3383124 RepID=UPI003D7D6E3F
MNQAQVARVFVELADTLVDDFDLVDFFHLLTERCVQLLDVTSAGLMLSDDRGRLQLVAATSTLTRSVELFELQVDEGPCVDCFRSGEPVVDVDLTRAHERWPEFTAAANAAGLVSTHALPMRLRHRVIGALNLFSDRRPTLGRESLELGRAMADIATIGLLNERYLREQTVLAEQLQAALDSRVVIEQAKGVLAARSASTVDEAFARLRRHARHRGTSLTAVATAVVHEGFLLDDERSTHRP